MYMWRNARRNTWQKCNNVSVNNVQVKLVGCLKYIQVPIITIIINNNNDDDDDDDSENTSLVTTNQHALNKYFHHLYD